MDNLGISQRLVELSPTGQQAATVGPGQAVAEKKKYFDTVIVLACLAPGAALLYSVL